MISRTTQVKVMLAVAEGVNLAQAAGPYINPNANVTNTNEAPWMGAVLGGGLAVTITVGVAASAVCLIKCCYNMCRDLGCTDRVTSCFSSLFNRNNADNNNQEQMPILDGAGNTINYTKGYSAL